MIHFVFWSFGYAIKDIYCKYINEGFAILLFFFFSFNVY